MKIHSNQVPDKLICTIYSQNGIEIMAILSPLDGDMCFEAYINGEYVLFSRDRKLSGTLLSLNHTLSLMEGKGK